LREVCGSWTAPVGDRFTDTEAWLSVVARGNRQGTPATPISVPSGSLKCPTTSGTFLASELLSGKRAAQGWFGGWLGVLPKSSSRGVGVEPEDVKRRFWVGSVSVRMRWARGRPLFPVGESRTVSWMPARLASSSRTLRSDRYRSGC